MRLVNRQPEPGAVGTGGKLRFFGGVYIVAVLIVLTAVVAYPLFQQC